MTVMLTVGAIWTVSALVVWAAATFASNDE
jgi:hypothetical protein